MIITHRWTCESNMEETITCKGPCERKNWPKYGRSSFLRHISQAKTCRAMYTVEEIDTLKQSSHKFQIICNVTRWFHYMNDKACEKSLNPLLISTIVYNWICLS